MEYGEFIDYNEEHLINSNFTRFVGYADTSNELRNRYFNLNVVRTISTKLTELLKGVDEQNRRIIVPDKTIADIMDSVYKSYRPQTGDIYGRYNVPNASNKDDYVSSLIDQTIEIIYSQVKNDFETEQNNKGLSVWTTLLGDFNDRGLRSHPPIKILNNTPQLCAFFENY